MYSDPALPLTKLLPDPLHNALEIHRYWESYGMKSLINVQGLVPICLFYGPWKAV